MTAKYVKSVILQLMSCPKRKARLEPQSVHCRTLARFTLNNILASSSEFPACSELCYKSPLRVANISFVVLASWWMAAWRCLGNNVDFSLFWWRLVKIYRRSVGSGNLRCRFVYYHRPQTLSLMFLKVLGERTGLLGNQFVLILAGEFQKLLDTCNSGDSSWSPKCLHQGNRGSWCWRCLAEHSNEYLHTTITQQLDLVFLDWPFISWACNLVIQDLTTMTSIRYDDVVNTLQTLNLIKWVVLLTFCEHCCKT